MKDEGKGTLIEKYVLLNFNIFLCQQDIDGFKEKKCMTY